MPQIEDEDLENGIRKGEPIATQPKSDVNPRGQTWDQQSVITSKTQYFDKSDSVSNMADNPPTSTADKDISKKRRSARLEIARIKDFSSREVDGYYSQMNEGVRPLTEEENAVEEVIQTSMNTASEGVKKFHLYFKKDKELAISYLQDAAEILDGCLNMLNDIPQEFMFLKKIADEMNKLAELLKGIREISKMKTGRLEIAEAVKSLLSYVGALSYLMDIRKQELTEEEYKREKAYHTLMIAISNKMRNLSSSVKEDKEYAIKWAKDAAQIIESCFKLLRDTGIPEKMMFFEKIAEKSRKLAELLKGQDESDDSTGSDSGDDEPSAKRINPMEESF
ncbi:hypothetical protein B9Z55_007842 [Caenorhabditis nigoni]|uniref:Uncharacterized protein n=1 Tax=Caenorhabditis nigoni TaxID=1611254 RepID=A0A2G5VBG8_9PELO|nr:hypothetical protein B9Z55_007842 [Caenorhabditis nigoni]